MTQKLIIIALLLLVVYLYYQNRKLSQLPANSLDNFSGTIFDWDEEKQQELIAEKDQLTREKGELEQENLSLNNRLKNKHQEVSRKETEIERLKKEKSQSEISLNAKLKEKNGLITTLQREVNQLKEKYSKQGQLLDTEQLEAKRLEEELDAIREALGGLKTAGELRGILQGRTLKELVLAVNSSASTIKKLETRLKELEDSYSDAQEDHD